jgi:hypothetical protein
MLVLQPEPGVCMRAARIDHADARDAARPTASAVALPVLLSVGIGLVALPGFVLAALARS